MEQNSLNDISKINILEAQIRECYGRVVYSHKTHEKCADLLLLLLKRIKLTQITLSVITTGGLIDALFRTEKIAIFVSLICSVVLTLLNTYLKNFDLGEIAEKHKQSANDLWLLREKYLSLLTDLRIRYASLNELLDKRDALLDELHSIYTGAPTTNLKAYKLAQDSLKKYEEMTFSEDEINAFLPKELHRNNESY